jgi:hypothetical protein
MQAITPKTRWLAAALAACVCLAAATALADSTDDAVRKANELAYEAAMKCFVADGILTGDERERGDKAKEVTFEAKARQSFETAEKLGDVLGYSGTRVNEDFGLAQAREMAKLMYDAAYFKRAAATCKALGLM